MNPGLYFQRFVPGSVECAAYGDANGGTYSRFESFLDGGGIHDRRKDHPGIFLAHQFSHNGVAVTRCTRAGRVSCIHHDDGSRIDFGSEPDAFFKAGQGHLHLFVMLPEPVCQIHRVLGGGGFIAIHDNDTICSKLRDIGERVSPHHASRKTRFAGFDPLRQLNTFANRPGLGDHFIATHQRRDLDSCSHGADVSTQHPGQ